MTKPPFNALDGHLARQSNAYAREKLYYVEHYQKIFATGMKFFWPNRVYIDLLAGPGRCRLADSSVEFDGSPLLAERAPFTKRILVESSPALAAALRHRVTMNPVILEADCNDPETIARIRAEMPRGALGLAFVDNLGTQVTLATLRALTVDRRIDLMIVVQIGDITRNILSALAGNHSRERFDAFFGEGWVTVVNDLVSKNAESRTIADALVEFYEGRLASIGYDYVAKSTAVMKNSTNAAQYRLVLAGKDARAVDFFRKIERINPHGQRGLSFD
jgi:three-Cys-motif partner protein